MRELSLTVIYSLYRLYGKILIQLVWLTKTDEQSGFRTSRSTIDKIFCIIQLNEKILATGGKVHMVFLDLVQAYDPVPINQLFRVHNHFPTNIILIKAVKEILRNAGGGELAIS